MMKLGGKVVRWTADENSRLFRMQREGFAWEQIAEALPGRTIAACLQRVQYAKRKAAAIKRRGEYVAPPVPVPVALVELPAAVEVQGRYGARRVSTHVLVIDAELRARIELQGLTAGLLGDPLPGRSALDEWKARHG